jgi:lipooligosaccharide transport system ATP-binding protein
MDDSTAPFLRAEGLSKRYGDRLVVDRLDLGCRERSVLGLLGPNGAGKTTTLRMLYGFIDPEAGRIEIDGRDFRTHRSDLKRLLGVCTQEDTLDYDFSVRQNLSVYATYFRPRGSEIDRRVDELLERFDLASYAAQSPHTLSGGFKRRLLIARSIVHRPRILFLDEPTTGLDPKARVDVWELVDGLRTEGLGIVLTTHYMDEAERLSDELLVLSEGRERARGTPAHVLGSLLGDHILVVVASTPGREGILAWIERTLDRTPARVLGEVRVPINAQELAALSAAFPDSRLTVRPPNLDDLFLSLSKDGTP